MVDLSIRPGHGRTTQPLIGLKDRPINDSCGCPMKKPCHGPTCHRPNPRRRDLDSDDREGHVISVAIFCHKIQKTTAENRDRGNETGPSPSPSFPFLVSLGKGEGREGRPMSLSLSRLRVDKKGKQEEIYGFSLPTLRQRERAAPTDR